MHLIFDFDGTLVDSFETMLAKFLEISDEYGVSSLQQADLNHLRGLSSKALVRHLKIPFYKLPSIIYRVRKSVAKEIGRLQPFTGLPEALHRLSQQGFQLGILTSNSVENVNQWLLQQNLHQLFEFVHNEENFFGKHRVLKRLMKLYGITNFDMLYIGDETRDIEAANKNQIHSIAVTWGFNSEAALRKARPSFIVHSPKELVEVIEQNARTTTSD